MFIYKAKWQVTFLRIPEVACLNFHLYEQHVKKWELRKLYFSKKSSILSISLRMALFTWTKNPGRKGCN